MRRNALVIKSPLTTHEINERSKERDSDPVAERLPCGCVWMTGKGGTSTWSFSPECGPNPPPYPSKRKYRGN